MGGGRTWDPQSARTEGGRRKNQGVDGGSKAEAGVMQTLMGVEKMA